MSIFSSVYNLVVGLSPQTEIFFRNLYWKNVKVLKKIKPLENKKKNDLTVDFNAITSYLVNKGVLGDDIVIVHSSLDSLAGSGLDAETIIDKLKEIIPNGTLAMPAIRGFEEDCDYENYITTEDSDSKTVYDVWNSKIISGFLPFALLRYDEAVVSKCPLNPLVAIGKDAEKMMEHNIEGEHITAHGEGSCWKYCVDKDAWNIGIGVELKGFLTIHHVFQELTGWPVNKWFFERKFTIKDGKQKKDIIVEERRHLWTKYLAENHFYNDLVKAGVIMAAKIEGVNVYMCKSSELARFISNHPNPTYPYYIPKSKL